MWAVSKKRVFKWRRTSRQRTIDEEGQWTKTGHKSFVRSWCKMWHTLNLIPNIWTCLRKLCSVGVVHFISLTHEIKIYTIFGIFCTLISKARFLFFLFKIIQTTSKRQNIFKEIRYFVENWRGVYCFRPEIIWCFKTYRPPSYITQKDNYVWTKCVCYYSWIL